MMMSELRQMLLGLSADAEDAPLILLPAAIWAGWMVPVDRDKSRRTLDQSR